LKFVCPKPRARTAGRNGWPDRYFKFESSNRTFYISRTTHENNHHPHPPNPHDL
jgi:hypothetical protein